MGYLLPEAELRWQAGTPHSSAYGDLYWQAGQALAEKSQVFLAPLQRRLADVRLRRSLQFTVGELGFGFGVNCLLVADWWREMPKDAVLHYVAVEGHPVSKRDLQAFRRDAFLGSAALDLSKRLLENWPGACQGQHLLWLADNVRLLLVHREATQALGDLDAQADAWFLDGFAPARNPSMWTQRLFRLLFARSRPGALIASYSVAGEVQRRLASAGFIPQRVPGFGRKREALAGRRRGDWQPLYRRAPRALIVGAGLAGGFCSEALRKRGLDAPLVGGAAGKASDVPQLAVFPQLAVRAEERHRLSLAACRYMLDAPGLRRTGVIRLPKNQAEAARFRRIAEQFPDDFIEWRDGRLHYHQAGWWSFADFAEALGLAPRDAWATRIWQAGDGWRCQLEDGSQLRADALVLATGADNALIGNPLGLHWVRGQALSVPGLDLQQVITGPASLFPPRQGRSVISGSYARGRGLAPSDADTRALLKAAAELLPKTDLNPKDATTYVGIRAATRDRLPAVGTLPLALLAPAKGAKSAPAPEAPDFPEASQPSGLYLCNGFGSHGATQARLCAEHLVSRLLGEPSPLSRAQQKLIAPERFAIRDSRASRQSAAP